MAECICSGCKNLKSVVKDENEEPEFECEYGFPSERCTECGDEECDETCEHYEDEDELEDELVTVHCSRCNKELVKAVEDDEEGEILCVDCFFKGE